MPSKPSSRRAAPGTEAIAQGRRIAGGLASFGLGRNDVVAILLHHDPVYLSVMHGCRTAGCRVRQVSPHSTAEQIASALAEPGVKAVFAHEDFLPVLAGLRDEVELIAVAPLSLFPGVAPQAKGRHFHAYHQWLPLQEERDSMLPGRRSRVPAPLESAAVGSDAYRDCVRMLAAITRAAAFPPPPADEASPRSAGSPEKD